jgi:hypothetical protein
MVMRGSLCRVPGIAATASLILSIFPAALSAQPRVQTLYAHVADAAGKPVTSLGPSDFQMSKDGAPQRISRVIYSGNPKRILLLVDTSDALSPAVINPLRQGLTTFINSLPADAEVVLATMGGQFHIRVEPTTDRAELARGIGGIFPEGGTTVLMDAIVEGNTRFLVPAEARAPVIVVVTTEGSDSSSTRDDKFPQFVNDMAGHGTVAYAVVLGLTAIQADVRPTAGANRRIDNAIQSNDTDGQSIVAMDITKYTSGRYEHVNSATAVADKLKSFAADITADRRNMAGWYQIGFESPTVPRSVRVQVLQPDARIQLSPDRPGKKK